MFSQFQWCFILFSKLDINFDLKFNKISLIFFVSLFCCVEIEYATPGRVSRKGDVHSFGILLLEIFTLKKPTDYMFVGDCVWRQWVCDTHPGVLLDIVDCNLFY